MPEPGTLAVFAVASLAVLVVPGPSVLYIVSRTVAQGRRAGLVSVLGVQAGGLVHILAAAAGLSAILASSATAFAVVRYAGAAYLVYLGIRTLLAGAGDGAPAPPRDSRVFWQGALVDALNPKTALFFLAFLPQFVDPARGAAALQIGVLGLVFLLVACLSDGSYALLAGGARRRLARHRSAPAWLGRLSGATYIGLGACAALSGHRPARSG